MAGDLKVRVSAVQRDLESLLKLLGGTPEERLRFWEIVKGITTPAVHRVIDAQLEAVEAQLKSSHAVLGALHVNAKELGHLR
jgi:hypothetical protein